MLDLGFLLILMGWFILAYVAWTFVFKTLCWLVVRNVVTTRCWEGPALYRKDRWGITTIFEVDMEKESTRILFEGPTDLVFYKMSNFRVSFEDVISFKDFVKNFDVIHVPEYKTDPTAPGSKSPLVIKLGWRNQ